MAKWLTQNVREILESQYPDEVIFEHKGVIYHVVDDEEHWKQFRDKVEPEWSVMQERSGLQHWVVYNPKVYKAASESPDFYSDRKSWLECRDIHADNLELPINASSCWYMFLGQRFTQDFVFPESFDTSEIVDMECMFYGCTINNPDIFKNGLDTSKVVYMNSMFAHSTYKNGLKLGPKFNNASLKSCDHMFEECDMFNRLDLGNKFRVNVSALFE